MHITNFKAPPIAGPMCKRATGAGDSNNKSQ
jgi:hypothetical protein